MPKKIGVIATRDSPYGGRTKAGDPLNVSPAVARVMVALGRARYAPVEASKVPGVYKRRDMQVEKAGGPTAPPGPVPTVGKSSGPISPLPPPPVKAYSREPSRPVPTVGAPRPTPSGELSPSTPPAKTEPEAP